MVERRIAISALDRAGALQALQDLQDLRACLNYDSICLDFTSLGRVEPLGMMLFAASLKNHREEVRRSRPDIRFRADGFERHSYPAHMGFFRMFGLEFGKETDEAVGGTRYEPIRFIDLNEIERSASEKYLDVHDGIEARSEEMARLLVQGEDSDLCETLAYCLREIIRNSLEHARVSGLWYCAQYWPTRDVVELALLDQGIGIRASLGRNPHVDLPSDTAALSKALQPGISGVAYKGARVRRKDPWQNSGFGLYMTSQIAGRHGEFFIGSGDAGLARSNGRELLGEFRFKGTAISIRLRPSKLASLGETLGELRRAAANRPGKTEISDTPIASMSSMMLPKDFDSQK